MTGTGTTFTTTYSKPIKLVKLYPLTGFPETSTVSSTTNSASGIQGSYTSTTADYTTTATTSWDNDFWWSSDDIYKVSLRKNTLGFPEFHKVRLIISGYQSYYTTNWQPCYRDAFIDSVIPQKTFKSNLLIQVKSRANLVKDVPENERVALESLREAISERDFRKYIKYGFLLVKGSSGDVYQIFRNRSHTKVWRGGKLIEEVCVRIKDSKIPPTDNILAFKTLIHTNEEEFKKMGNVYKMAKAA